MTIEIDFGKGYSIDAKQGFFAPIYAKLSQGEITEPQLGHKIMYEVFGVDSHHPNGADSDYVAGARRMTAYATREMLKTLDQERELSRDPLSDGVFA